MPPATPATEPSRELRFSFSYADARGRTWEGVFLWRRPTVRDLIRIEAERARLCEGQALDPAYTVLATMLARLKVVLRETPTWCRWDELEDPRLITQLHEEVERIEQEWFRWLEPRGGGEEPGAAAGPRGGAAVPAAPVVDPQVPAAADVR